jgi:uncharacterized membrane protein YeaQ/YmgE (transglycosylase-associated protein family)
MSYSIVKSVTSGLVVAGVDKLYYKESGKQSLSYGAVDAGVVFIVDNIVGATILNSLGIVATYGQDLLSSILFALTVMLMDRSKLIKSHGLLADTLIGLAGAVIGTYTEAPIRNLLPGTGTA